MPVVRGRPQAPFASSRSALATQAPRSPSGPREFRGAPPHERAEPRQRRTRQRLGCGVECVLGRIQVSLPDENEHLRGK